MIFTSLIIFLAIIFACIFMGSFLLKLFRIDTEKWFLEEIVLSFGSGVGVFALIVLFLGMIGQLSLTMVSGVLLIGFVVSFQAGKDLFIRGTLWAGKIRSTRLTIYEKFLIFVIIFVWGISLIGNLSPLLGTDAVSYHMRDAKIFAERGVVSHIPYTRESLWPFLVQMLFSVGMLFKSIQISKMFNFAFGFFGILFLYTFVRRYFKRETAILTATVFGTIPAIFLSAKYAYTDLAVVFYTIGSFYCFFRWIEKKTNSWLYMSGVFCGFLLGIKITSLVVPLIIGSLCFYELLKNSDKKWVKSYLFSMTGFLAVIGLICSVWYIRSWVILGNPIFPFAGYVFDGNGYKEQFLKYQTTSGLGVGPWQYIKMLWPLTMRPDIFGGESIGFGFLLFLPAIFFVGLKSKFVRYVGVIFLALYTSWFIVYQYTRFLYPTLIFASILVGYIISTISEKDKFLRNVFNIFLFGMFFYSMILGTYHNLGNFPYVFGFESENEYRLTHERSYEMAKFTNETLPEKSRLLVFGWPDLLYFDNDAVDEFCYRMETRYDLSILPQNRAKHFKDEGFTHIIVTKDLTLGRDENYTDPSEYFGRSNITFLRKTNFEYKGEKTEYELWKLM